MTFHNFEVASRIHQDRTAILIGCVTTAQRQASELHIACLRDSH